LGIKQYCAARANKNIGAASGGAGGGSACQTIYQVVPVQPARISFSFTRSRRILGRNKCGIEILLPALRCVASDATSSCAPAHRSSGERGKAGIEIRVTGDMNSRSVAR